MLFILLGAIMILALHAGFAFLEPGTVRKKNQVNAITPPYAADRSPTARITTASSFARWW